MREPVKICTPRFTLKEVEPFVVIEHRDGARDGSLVFAVIGVAIQKADGRWGVHELSDEVDACRALSRSASAHAIERMIARATVETQKRLVEALNRLREHYGRVYIYSAR